MPLARDTKEGIVADHARSDSDTGSPEVQIAILSRRIGELTEHFKEGKEEDIKRAAELIDELDLEWTKNDWHPEETT